MTNKQYIEDKVKRTHLKWLGRAETAKINGSEMTVLPYGYLSQAIKDTLTTALKEREREILQKAKAIIEAEKKYYGTDKHGLSYEQLEDIISKKGE